MEAIWIGIVLALLFAGAFGGGFLVGRRGRGHGAPASATDLRQAGKLKRELENLFRYDGTPQA